MFLLNKRLLFIHIPKCAGTSVEFFFTGKDGTEGALKHATAQESRTAIDGISPDIWPRLFKFSVVRNPWARFLSFFHLVRNAQPDIVFDDWIRAVCSPEGLVFQGLPVQRSMTEYLCAPDGTMLMDFVGKVESLEADFPVIVQRARMAAGPLPRAMVMKYDRDYRKWYTSETRDLVGARFREDIERFGYDY